MARHIASSLSIILSGITLVRGQYEYGSIASCADFDCNTGLSNCTIEDRSYNVAGSVEFQSPLGDNLTWTTGAVMTYPDGPEYPNLVKDYFLGTPSDMDLTSESGVNGFHGCAAFFVDSNASFPLNQEPGTCSDVLGGDCVSALMDRATEASGGSTFSSASDLCSSLREALNSSLPPSECSSMTLDGDWGRIRFKALTGPDAPTPPTEAQNASSNCHPVVPSSYNLAFALNFNASCCDDSLWSRSQRGIGNDTNPNDETIIDFLEHQAVPILTVFAPSEDNEEGDVSQSSVSTLTCLEAPVEAKNMANETGDPDGDDENAAAVSSPHAALAWVLTAIAAGFAAFV